MKKLLSFVIPCYRSELTIEKVIDEIIITVSQRKKEYDYEIICVNDFSPDNLLSVLRKLASRNSRIKIIDFAKNMGKHSAILAGCAYARVSCEMDAIMDIAKRYKLMVVEDAAQGVMSKYKGQALGTIGDFGCYSFHETKNYSMGEGGALLIKNSKYNERAEILREKGTNRTRFLRGQMDKYTWVNFGDSYLPSELNSAYLWGQ